MALVGGRWLDWTAPRRVFAAGALAYLFPATDARTPAALLRQGEGNRWLLVGNP